MLEKEGLALRTCEKLKLENIEPKNEEWEKMIFSVKKRYKQRHKHSDSRKVCKIRRFIYFCDRSSKTWRICQ